MNPIIVAFFRNIGYADQLGAGVRNLFKYSKLGRSNFLWGELLMKTI